MVTGHKKSWNSAQSPNAAGEDPATSPSIRPIYPFTSLWPQEIKARQPRRNDNDAETRRFECDICHVRFTYKHVLQNHIRTHTGEKPFVCKHPGCDKSFTRDHHLKTHMRLHTGEKPYACLECGKQFVQVANLRRHQRVHTKEAIQSYVAAYPELSSFLHPTNPMSGEHMNAIQSYFEAHPEHKPSPYKRKTVVAPIYKPIKEEPKEEVQKDPEEETLKKIELRNVKQEVFTRNFKEEPQNEPEDLSLKSRK